MLISEFDYELPEELIAQKPLAERSASRMLVVNRAAKSWRDEQFKNFPAFLHEGDVLVLNNTKVFPARLIGNRENFTGKIEIFLVREIEKNVWEALARPARRIRIGTNLIFGLGRLRAKVLEKSEDGRLKVEFDSDDNFYEVLESVGQTPLPPYIRRPKESDENVSERDRNRYQTVFARERGAIAAPTAGLHFTPEVLAEIKRRGIQTAEITLHVGYGTFEPVRVEDLSEHRVAPETSTISQETAEIVNRAKAENRRIIAIGTTTTRSLESAADENGEVSVGARAANLTIVPGYKFRVIDALLTNFHLPQSSLLVLVSTFAGHHLTMSAYKHAVAEKYRFYSYGDCMFIV
ncbi:MAG: tRNA preQ1(34) S-adenosylmethionine ribosyltransferase-isomerase QueA [Acidobacteriota bacterium]|nr:tRNA preQ1(34) S-adenosylmethionine ribosyltransferase-isomerase QueA [Acidobacteriota bacterium]